VEFAAFFLLVLSVLCGLVDIASLVFLAVGVGR
jgi:hypothetical protein